MLEDVVILGAPRRLRLRLRAARWEQDLLYIDLCCPIFVVVEPADGPALAAEGPLQGPQDHGVRREGHLELGQRREDDAGDVRADAAGALRG